ncbi:hypothetical protein Q8G44_27910, partial [Klebsiella pneumoniae]
MREKDGFEEKTHISHNNKFGAGSGIGIIIRCTDKPSRQQKFSAQMTDMEFKGSANRIRKCACDLLSIGG